VPYPSKDGGSIAMYNLTKAFLANNQEVFMLAINTKKHHVQLNTINEPFFKTAFFQAVNVDTSVRPLSAFLNLFSKKSYNIERFKNQQVEKELIQLLKENTFDIIQLESIFVSAYVSTIRKYSKAKVILRSHNVEFKIKYFLFQKKVFKPACFQIKKI
jgi:hypothetical protein